MATNCWVLPAAIDGVAGVTAIESSAAAVTVKVVFPLTLFRVVVIVAVPVALAVARPALVIDAVALSELSQVALAVTSTVEPSV